MRILWIVLFLLKYVFAVLIYYIYIYIIVLWILLINAHEVWATIRPVVYVDESSMFGAGIYSCLCCTLCLIIGIKPRVRRAMK